MVIMGNEGLAPHGFGEYDVKAAASQLVMTKAWVRGRVENKHSTDVESRKHRIRGRLPGYEHSFNVVRSAKKK